jgi:hypothetical protein
LLSVAYGGGDGMGEAMGGAEEERGRGLDRDRMRRGTT